MPFQIEIILINPTAPQGPSGINNIYGTTTLTFQDSGTLAAFQLGGAVIWNNLYFSTGYTGSGTPPTPLPMLQQGAPIVLDTIAPYING